MRGSSYDQQIVIDLEFTPTRKDLRKQGLKQEIIQIGAVKLDGEGREVSTFSVNVWPECTQCISRQVSNLTGIWYQNVEGADAFGVALQKLAAWIGDGRTRMVAWSKSDQKQLYSECAFKGIEVPANMRRWLDLQVVYPRVMEVGKRGRLMALRAALDWHGVALDMKEAHCALYDAKATAELLRQLMTGEYLQQKRILAEVMPQRRESEPVQFTCSLGSMCSGLAELRQALSA